MLKVLLARARQGTRTAPFPTPEPGLPALFRGRPVLEPQRCTSGCADGGDSGPTEALRLTQEGVDLHLGRFSFCCDGGGARTRMRVG